MSVTDEGTGSALVAAIRRRFASFGDVVLDLPERGPGREPPVFDQSAADRGVMPTAEGAD